MFDIIKTLVVVILAVIAIVRAFQVAPINPAMPVVGAVKCLVLKLTGARTESK
jgi:hypothetical protein